MPEYETLDEEEYKELVDAQVQTLKFIEQLNKFDYSTLYHVNS